MNALSHHGTARTGAGPGLATARSARALRLRLSGALAPVFLVLSGLLAWGAAETEPGDTQTVVAVLSSVCFFAFCAALIDAVRVALGMRRERRSSAV
jgi:hypothetical protein